MAEPKLFEVVFKAEQWISLCILSESGDRPDDDLLDDLLGDIDFDDLEIEYDHPREVDVSMPLTKEYPSALGKRRSFFSVHDVLDSNGQHLAGTTVEYQEALSRIAALSHDEVNSNRGPLPGQKEIFE